MTVGSIVAGLSADVQRPWCRRSGTSISCTASSSRLAMSGDGRSACGAVRYLQVVRQEARPCNGDWNHGRIHRRPPHCPHDRLVRRASSGGERPGYSWECSLYWRSRRWRPCSCDASLRTSASSRTVTTPDRRGAAEEQAAQAASGLRPSTRGQSEEALQNAGALDKGRLVLSFGTMGMAPAIFHQVAYVQDKGFGLGYCRGRGRDRGLRLALVCQADLGVRDRAHSRSLGDPHVRHPRRPLALLPLIVAESLTMLYVYGVFFGLTMGGWPHDCNNLAWASYFGRQHQGAIRGFVTPIGNITGAASPLLGGFIWDRYGAYDLAFVVYGAAWILCGLLMLAAVPPTPPTQADAQGEQLAAGAR